MSDPRVITAPERAFLKDVAAQRDGDDFCAFDVGANCGEWTAALFEHIPAAVVFAFEPQRAAAEAYRGRHWGPGVTVMPFGLSSMNGDRTMFASEHPECVLATMHDRPDRDDYHGRGVALDRVETVEVMTLDAFVAHNAGFPAVTDHIPPGSPDRKAYLEAVTGGNADSFIQYGAALVHRRINLLKLDVEGHEYDVLVGGASTIRLCVDLIQFEFNDSATAANVRFGDLYHALESAGYRGVWRLQGEGRRRVTPDDVTAGSQEESSADFVAVHDTCEWFRP